MKMTEAQKARYWRELKGRQQDYTDYTNERLRKEEEERVRLERQKERDNDPFSGLTDIVESAISAIPVVGKYVSEPIHALRAKLEGGLLRERLKTLGKRNK